MTAAQIILSVLTIYLAIGACFAAVYSGWAKKSITGYGVTDTLFAVLTGPIFLTFLARWKLRNVLSK
ncbi:hypothetical protein [Bradyrhizobium cenepequi]